MALDNAKNFAKVEVSTGYDASATSIILSASEGAKLPTVSFNAVWYNSTDYTDPTDDPNREIVRVTNISTDTLTVTRAQEGTSAATHNTGGKTYKMIAGLTAKTINTDLGSTFEPLKGDDDNYVTDAEKVVIGNTSGTNSGDETATRIGTIIGGAGDATPNDTDFVATSLTAGGILKKITWTNAKAFLKTYFDTLYAVITQLPAPENLLKNGNFINNSTNGYGTTADDWNSSAMEMTKNNLFNYSSFLAYWKLEDTADSKGAFTLTNNGTVTFGSAKFSNGADLGTSNTTKYMSVANDLGITSGAISISLWVKLNSEITTGSYAFFDHGDAGVDVRHRIQYDFNAGARCITFNRQKENSSNDQFTYTVNLGTSDWYNIVYSYDGTTLRGYVNGVFVGSVACSGNGVSGVDIDYTYIGATRNNTPLVTNYSNAIIDDVAVFNIGLTEGEARMINLNPQVVQGGIPALTKQNLIDGLAITDGEIEGLWPLNESSGNASDLSSSSYTLTDTNTVGSSSTGLMTTARDFEAANSECLLKTTPTNLLVAGSQTWIAFIKPETLTTSQEIMAHSDAGVTVYGLLRNQSGAAIFQLAGLTTTSSITADVTMQIGKWYMVVGVYDSVSSKIKIWVNGIKKEATASGSHTITGTQSFAIGQLGAANTSYFDGLIQNACILSTALSDSQVKKLLAMTIYKGKKIGRATTDSYIYQRVPQDIVERLRGKTVALRADIYQDTASTGQISIHQTMADATTSETIISATDATTGSWLTKVATGTLESDVTTIELRIKNSNSDGNVWVRYVSLYEGSVALPYDHSKDDWSRFPTLLQMRFINVFSGYQYEERRSFVNPFTPAMRASGSMTVTNPVFSLKKFSLNGETGTNAMTVNFTNAGSASVVNYYVLPFIIEPTSVTASNGRAVHLVNNALQTVGVARPTSTEAECYIYSGGNWSLTSNTIHDATVYNVNVT